jgi:hypothetical protein
MKIKNAMKSEECNEIRAILGLANNLIKKVLELEQKENTPSEIAQVSLKLSHVQTLLCNVFGSKLDETLKQAQEIEAEDGQEIIYLSRSKPTQPQDEETTETSK